MALNKLAQMPKKTNTFRCITFFCNKGGNGKTTSAVMFASILAAKGYKVLLIDNDGQANASDFTGAPLIPQTGIVRTEDLYWDINTNSPSMEDKINSRLLVSAIQESEIGYGYIESSNKLNAVIKSITNDNLKFTLWRITQTIKNSFDFCIIDSPCSADVLSANSIIAADDVIITIATESDTEKTLVNNIFLFENLKREYKASANIDRVLPVKVKTPSHVKEVIPMIAQFVKDNYNSKTSSTYIKYSADIENCMMARDRRIECIRSGRGSEAFIGYFKAVEEYLKDHAIEDNSYPRIISFTGVEGEKKQKIVFERLNFIQEAQVSIRSFFKKEGIKGVTSRETYNTSDPYKRYRIVVYISNKNGKTYTNKAAREVIQKFLENEKIRYAINVKDEQFFINLETKEEE